MGSVRRARPGSTAGGAGAGGAIARSGAATVTDVTIVVVTHESAGDIGACLHSVRQAMTEVVTDVVVVDNASKDGTADLVERSFPWATLVRGTRRRGFSANSNAGAALARGRHLLFLNPDARMHPGTLRALVSYLDERPHVGAVGPRLHYPDGAFQASARRFPSPAGALVRRTPIRLAWRNSALERNHLMFDAVPTKAAQVDWLLGAALAVRGVCFQMIGGFDDGFRLYCEDIDLCWRLHRGGWSVDYLPDVTVEHDLSELTRKRFFHRASIWHMRSMIRFMRLHGLAPRRWSLARERRILVTPHVIAVVAPEPKPSGLTVS